MNRTLIILGAGGHARVVARLARLNGWGIGAILDRVTPTASEQIEGVVVSGPFAAAAEHFAAGIKRAVVAIGDNEERKHFFEELTRVGFEFPILRHPTAIVEEDATLGPGTVVCAGAIIGTHAAIGADTIINTGAIIDHECVIGSHTHLAPGCRLAGRVRVGDGTMIGIGSCVREKQQIGERTVIGAGSVVVDDFPAGIIAVGNPARLMRARTP